MLYLETKLELIKFGLRTSILKPNRIKFLKIKFLDCLNTTIYKQTSL